MKVTIINQKLKNANALFLNNQILIDVLNAKIIFEYGDKTPPYIV